ncbi:amino acid-binding protein [Slackia heliotrinireducens]|jgi:hypothetical protein|uniref:ACT domain-containing protein n=1 Tax=Slackia heliotrinireducens (strain ATCC 29202 / DSM 20476 / NCTC 11029 / RHS 1) TaxID=471855 RepID=C7N630_SLAHD|nr:amino acid-binding protein [Slackia heliotrinireducens]ACV22365.1 ACT domain-containing protein [Slackia heliotrinireducens DSM 20476]VEH00643.1 ACT domain-containing protein [Slackia heliotrinireducens]
MIEQLSVFLVNDKGRLAHLTRRLAKNNINLHALFIADTSEFGVVRIFCDTPRKAADVLNAAGYRARVNSVVAVKVPDEPGGLAKLLEFLDANDFNIEYGYCVSHSQGSAMDVLKIDDDSVEDKLVEAGFEVYEAKDVYTLDD